MPESSAWAGCSGLGAAAESWSAVSCETALATDWAIGEVVAASEFPEPPAPFSAEAMTQTPTNAPTPVRILWRANQERFGSGAGPKAGEGGTGLAGLTG